MSAPSARSASYPDAGAVMARAASENFPVASRVLPRRVRAHLLAVYGFARLVDELGDAAPGDRLAALDTLEQELDRAFEGRAQHPLLVRLQATLSECSLEREPFARLIEANRVDQRVARYETWAQLREYCALSADPVGEIVLGVLGAATPERVLLSDAICTALQLIEHCQDLAEDYAAGRIYMPAEDMRRFGCSPELLAGEGAAAGAPVPQPLRELLAFELTRARGLLRAGAPLTGQLRGRSRVAVAAFIAGGEAALEAIERSGYDVRSGPPRVGRLRQALALVRVLRKRHDGREERRDQSGESAPTRAHEPPMSTTSESTQAYRHCEAITRARAANFYYGIRLLPAHKRRAMCAVYAFARRVDDIGDGGLAPERKLEALAEQSHALADLDGSSQDPVMLALADACVRFPLSTDALGELIDGVRMDVEGVSYESFDDLWLYCHRVAGAVGRLCLAIFDARAQSAAVQELADDLGIALQLTNILRDVREDAENGRVYLPREDLSRFGLIAPEERRAQQVLATLRHALGVPGAGPNGASGHGALAPLMRFEAERARQWFDRGIVLAGLLDRRSAACVLAMAGIYERLLERIAAQPEQAIARRVALAPWEKAWVAAGSMLAPDVRARRLRAGASEPIGGHR